MKLNAYVFGSEADRRKDPWEQRQQAGLKKRISVVGNARGLRRKGGKQIKIIRSDGRVQYRPAKTHKKHSTTNTESWNNDPGYDYN